MTLLARITSPVMGSSIERSARSATCTCASGRSTAPTIAYTTPLLAWFDTEHGRGLFEIRNGWASVRPAADEDLADKFAEMERALVSGR